MTTAMAGPATSSGKHFLVQQLSALGLLISLPPGCSSPLHEGCGGSFNDSGTIATPNYPFTYPPNMRCVWNLTAKNGNVIFIEFVAIEIDVTGDLLLIYNGSTCVRNLTGFRSPFNLTLGPHVTLKFMSDESIGNLGFQLHWKTGISCKRDEYFDGHNCMPCTGAGNYVSRQVRNCSLDKDAEYAQEYSPPDPDVTDKAPPSSTILPKLDHAETTGLWAWRGPVGGFIGAFVFIAIVMCLLCIKRCMKSSEQSPSRQPQYSPLPAQAAT